MLALIVLLEILNKFFTFKEKAKSKTGLKRKLRKLLIQLK